jgi:AcrR family transcriptional regulator
MPKRRDDVDREVKTAQILDAATAQLMAGGYDGLSVAALARDLGIAQNAVYWYFATKDALVIAAVERMLTDIVSRKPPASQGLENQVLWFVDQLAELGDIRAGLAQRARASALVAAFVEDMNGRLYQLMRHALEPHVASKELDVASQAFLATVQGTYVSRLSKTARRSVLRYALRRLTAGG